MMSAGDGRHAGGAVFARALSVLISVLIGTDLRLIERRRRRPPRRAAAMASSSSKAATRAKLAGFAQAFGLSIEDFDAAQSAVEGILSAFGGSMEESAPRDAALEEGVPPPSLRMRVLCLRVPRVRAPWLLIGCPFARPLFPLSQRLPT